MKTSVWGWLILMAGSGIIFISNLVYLVRHFFTPQLLWIDSQVVRLALEAVQPLWKAVQLFLSVAVNILN